jgi:coenzyme F420-0:L-glutamate ligase/coenzyme F420-1:gamma-L-glutamate ligase
VRVGAFLLTKDPVVSKTRLGNSLDQLSRADLSRFLMRRSVTEFARLARYVDLCAVVNAGNDEVTNICKVLGLKEIRDTKMSGQNEAAKLAIEYALNSGCEAVCICSADLPYMNKDAIFRVIQKGISAGLNSVLAVPAYGRSGTNCLFISPPSIIEPVFGDNSIERFAQQALARGAKFIRVDEPLLALDIDDEADLNLALGQRHEFYKWYRSTIGKAKTIQVIPVQGMGEIVPGTDLALEIFKACTQNGIPIVEGDVIVIAQKAVSKAQGALVNVEEVRPSKKSYWLSQVTGHRPELIDIIVSISRRIIRASRHALIVETEHGFICANGGVDHSNLPGSNMVSLLPKDPDEIAKQLRIRFEGLFGIAPAVIITDTFGRPWRNGIVNVCIGLAGIKPINSLVGSVDDYGSELYATSLAIADEIAAAAGLAMGKTFRVPAVVVKGVNFDVDEKATIRQLLRSKDSELFA